MTLTRKEIEARYRKKNKEAIRLANVRHKFGLSAEQYNKMIVDQNNLCFICKKPETKTYKGKPYALAVDHCHTTGKIRKLLCHNCNVTLGRVEDNTEILENMIKYLQEE